MNETVIQEIANQLGIAAHQAGMFIQIYLPQYALLCASKTFISLGLILRCTVALIIVCKRLFSFLNNDDNYYKYNEIHDGLVVLFCCLAFSTIVLGLTFIIGCFVALPDAVSWLIFPEGQLIDMALNAIK